MIIGSVVLLYGIRSLPSIYRSYEKKQKSKKAVTLQYLSHFDTFLKDERERGRERERERERIQASMRSTRNILLTRRVFSRFFDESLRSSYLSTFPRNRELRKASFHFVFLRLFAADALIYRSILSARFCLLLATSSLSLFVVSINGG